MIDLKIQADWTDLQKVLNVNSKINNAIDWGQDIFVWGEKDYWATPDELFERGAGDCEDVAIAKYLILKQFNIKTKLAYVFKDKQPHMVCLYHDGLKEIVLDFPEKATLEWFESGLDLVFTFDEASLYVGGRVENSRKNLSMWNDVLNRLYIA
jgi:predicted transglutaminase-like cysteine proteinase